jgi:hypothetical protein
MERQSPQSGKETGNQRLSKLNATGIFADWKASRVANWTSNKGLTSAIHSAIFVHRDLKPRLKHTSVSLGHGFRRGTKT